MPSKTIPLFGPMTARQINADANISKDQRFVNCLFTPAVSEALGSKSLFVQKRPGWEAQATIAAGELGEGISFFNGNAGISTLFVGFGDTNTTIYSADGTSYGAITGRMTSFSPSIFINSMENLFIRSSDRTGWYLPYDVYTNSGNVTFTGDTHSNTTIDNIAGASALHVGQSISGTNIPANTRIATIVSATAITITNAATGAGSGITFTRGNLSKIIDADFNTTVTGGNFVEMDGYVFTCSQNGNIYNSNINNPDLWDASDYIAANLVGDEPVALAKSKGMLLCFGKTSIEFFRNAGNPFGSPLIGIKDACINIGLNSLSAITQIKDDIYFCSSTSYGGLEIYKLNGAALKKISTPQVENILGSQTSGTQYPIYLSSYVLNGQTYINVVRLDNIVPLSHDRTLVYCADTDIWTENTGDIATFISGLVFGTTNAIYGVTRGNTSGKLFRIRSFSPVYQDDGSSYTMTVQGEPVYLNGGKPFRVKWVDLLADAQSSGTAAFSVSGDDYGSFQSVGNFDLTSNRKRLYRVGYFKSHIIPKLEHTGATQCRGQGYVFDWEPCQ